MPVFALRALMEQDCKQFTTLVIDEAQDMLSGTMLDVLDALVVGGLNKGRWWLFCDRNNQASVFGVYEESALFRLIPIGVVSLLPTNRRNTIQIATDTEIKTLPQYPPVATVDGIPVKTDWYKKPNDQLRLGTQTRGLGDWGHRPGGTGDTDRFKPQTVLSQGLYNHNP